MQSLPTGYRALVLGASGAIGGALAAQLRDDPYCAKMLTLGRSTTPAVDFDARPALPRRRTHCLHKAHGTWCWWPQACCKVPRASTKSV